MRIIFDAHSVTNEHARVPGGTSQRGPSEVNVEEVDDDSGCEGLRCDDVTPSHGDKGKKKRSLPYSPNPVRAKRSDETTSRIDRILDFYEEDRSKNSVTSTSVDLQREEIGRMLEIVENDGAEEGSEEHFYATQLFMKKECRDVFNFLKTSKGRLAWLKRTWEEKTKKR